MKALLRILTAAGALLFSLMAHADTYPSKPIAIIVPFGPGSATDTIAGGRTGSPCVAWPLGSEMSPDFFWMQ